MPAVFCAQCYTRPFLHSLGRVEMWRGGFRSNISVAASFVWRCLSGSTMAPFPHPAHRALLRSFSPSRVSLPRYGCRVGLRIVLFEVCSAFTRVTACTLALSPYIVTRYPKASATSLPP